MGWDSQVTLSLYLLSDFRSPLHYQIEESTLIWPTIAEQVLEQGTMNCMWYDNIEGLD